MGISIFSPIDLDDIRLKITCWAGHLALPVLKVPTVVCHQDIGDVGRHRYIQSNRLYVPVMTHVPMYTSPCRVELKLKETFGYARGMTKDCSWKKHVDLIKTSGCSQQEVRIASKVRLYFIALQLR